MERLTEKNKANTPYSQTEYPYLESADINEITNKLGKLEDIEQELGITLEVLFNSEYVWTKSTRYKIHDIRLNKINKSISIYAITNGGTSTILESKNYKKIWAFNKEELE